MFRGSKIWLIISLTLFLISLRIFQSKKMNSLTEVYNRTVELASGRGLTVAQVKKLAANISRQAWHETGGFTSDIFKDNRNLFGMKASSRDYDKGTLHGHAYYNTYDDSIRDILAYMSERKGGLKSFVFDAVEDYASRLKGLNYFEDSLKNYIKGMKNAH